MKKSDSNRHLDSNGQWTVENFQEVPAFASFLPGLAGNDGIPIWAFYVNRGQAIASFGISDKNHSIIEFSPANKAFELVHLKGFRTFVKLDNGHKDIFFEPFSPDPDKKQTNSLKTGFNWLEIQSHHSIHNLTITVRYYVLPSEPFGGLVREVKIKNNSNDTIRGELYDGLPSIIPDGVSDQIFKNMGHTAMAWMQVDMIEPWLPLYRVSASIEDITEVKKQVSGHFYICGYEKNDEWTWLKPIIDPAILFESTEVKQFPSGLVKHNLSDIYNQEQILSGRIPCGIFGIELDLAPGEELNLHSLVGNVSDENKLKDLERFRKAAYWENKFLRAREITDDISSHIQTKTGFPVFDHYCSQSLIDNSLRGGYPFKSGPKNGNVFYLYNRKHGDLERDYNFFHTSSNYYSTGNGNYRDVNQNRRCDPWFQPAVYDSNIKTFINLIQTDGYNPLEYRGQELVSTPDTFETLSKMVNNVDAIGSALNLPYTPGSILKVLEDNNIELLVPIEEFVQTLINSSKREEKAVFHEGYWVDHWTYNLDLVENFLKVFPEKEMDLLFQDESYYFWDTSIKVNPRKVRYFHKDGILLQGNALYTDPDSEALIKSRVHHPHAVRVQEGHGEIFYTNLYTKLFIIAIVKFSTLDPEGMGIEMEAGKPGWCDAMNGLPALFASSLSETYELKRLLNFLSETVRKQVQVRSITLPIEAYELYCTLLKTINEWNVDQNNFLFWSKTSDARELYRSKTIFGFDGEMSNISVSEMEIFFDLTLNKVSAGIRKAKDMNNGLPPMYFTYDPNFTLKKDDINVESFKVHLLPAFLEACMKDLISSQNSDEAREKHLKVLNSTLYDNDLGMYRVNENIKNETPLIGRIHAFPRGWLENEAVFLHMHYKYLLGLLKTGCFSEFWDNAKSGLVPFMDPSVYGRSPLENVSFIASSVYPDKSMHGRGFYARLSGSTVEFLDMWRHIMIGSTPFSINNGKIHLKLQPILPSWLFNEENEVRFTFFGATEVVYKNPSRIELFPGDYDIISELALFVEGKQVYKQDSLDLGEPWSLMTRNQELSKIEITF